MHSTTRLLSACLLLLILANCRNTPTGVRSAGDVALYRDRGCWEESVQAAEKMFRWMGLSVAFVDAESLNEQGLGTFRILCIPGGNMYDYSQDLSSEGKEKIKSFIRAGGGYIGICGGAYFAAEEVIWRGEQLPMTSLALFQGTSNGPIDEIAPYPNYAMCKVDIVNSTHAITQSEPDSAWMLYYWGPALTVDNDPTVTILGRYDLGGEPVMLAFDYDLGRVFLIGTHPEIEEGSDRDGVTFADELDDRGSDWELMRKAVLWCLRE